MYRHNEKQRKFIEFLLPFGGKLLASNRWVRLAEVIPWHEFEEQYNQNLSKSGQGPPALSVRMALAALIIKERLGITDEECVSQIAENPYLQYFCGMSEFNTDAPFHSTMLVHFRKRFPANVLHSINEVIVSRAIETTDQDDDDQDVSSGGSGGAPNKGKLVLDATCVPADISYPTDLKLLNTAREKSEQVIDVLHKSRGKGHKKPRTYRIKARKAYLSAAKSKRINGNKLRKALRAQLGYLRRNLNSIEKLSKTTSLSALSRKEYRDLLVISELYRQQRWIIRDYQRILRDS